MVFSMTWLDYNRNVLDNCCKFVSFIFSLMYFIAVIYIDMRCVRKPIKGSRNSSAVFIARYFLYPMRLYQSNILQQSKTFLYLYRWAWEISCMKEMMTTIQTIIIEIWQFDLRLQIALRVVLRIILWLDVCVYVWVCVSEGVCVCVCGCVCVCVCVTMCGPTCEVARVGVH